jgi:hypothetical protein
MPYPCDRESFSAMSHWWLLAFIAMLFINGTVTWCFAQSRVTSRQREWRLRSGVPSIVDEAAAAPVIGWQGNPVDLVPSSHRAPR